MGGDCDFYDVNFYSYEDYTWENITDQVLPEMGFLDFWGFDTTFFIEQYLDINDNINWDYMLPRHGTTITVSIEAHEALICFELLESVDFENEDEFNMVMTEYYTTIRERPIYEIELKWNRKEGIFEVVE
jgi:hypothetical protein